MCIPGEIEHPRRFRQKVLFSGMRYKNVTPTDIDGFIEIRNKAYIFFELKHKSKECELGQKLALERLVDIIPLPAIAIIAEHDTDKTADGIMARMAIVREYRLKRSWEKPTWPINLDQIIRWFLRENQLGEYA